MGCIKLRDRGSEVRKFMNIEGSRAFGHSNTGS